jgi:hypothetical protein
MKTLHPGRMYTPPCGGVQRGVTPSANHIVTLREEEVPEEGRVVVEVIF